MKANFKLILKYSVCIFNFLKKGCFAFFYSITPFGNLELVKFKGKYKYAVFERGAQIVLVWAAVTNCQKLSGLNNRYLPLTVLEAGKLEIKGPADSVMVRVCQYLPTCCVLTWWRAEREKALVSSY